MNHKYTTFNGKTSIKLNMLFKSIKDSFTYEFWVKPKATQKIYKESTKGISGIGGQRYVVFPGHGGIEGEAGIGISVGNNGISVYEHTKGHMPALLVYKNSIVDWVHVAIVMKDKTPYLYINGKLVKVGLTSRMNSIYASGIIGGLDPYGFFMGSIYDLRIWDHARTENQINTDRNRMLKGNEPGLYLFWNSTKDKEIIVNNLLINNINQNSIKCTSIVLPRVLDTIVIISGGSAYNATRYFGYELKNSFTQLGYNVILVEDAEGLDSILEQHNVFFILGMNGHGINQLYKDVYENNLSVPYFVYLVDHPMYHIHRFDFNRSAKNLLISCVDQTHVEYLKTYFIGNYPKVFVPHGSALSITNFQNNPIKDRPIDILFAGTYISPDECRENWLSDPIYGLLMDEIMERTVYQHTESLLDIAEKVFLDKGMEFNYYANEKIKHLLIQGDFYIRGRRRKEVLEGLIDLPLQVYNQDWSYLQSMRGRIKVSPAINYDMFQRMMTQSKVVLNVLPNLVYGGHDRIFTSMLAGAVCLTDQNIYLDSWFKNEENILMFKLKETNFIETLQQYLLDPEKLQVIADKGKEIVEQEHTWSNRAKLIINHVNEYLEKFLQDE